MFKYITCYREGCLYIIKFVIEDINSNLRFVYEIYKVKDKHQYRFIEESFKTNPESLIFEDILGNIERVFIHSISQIEAGEELSKFNVDYNNLQNIGILKLPKLTINIENYKLGVVYNLLKLYFEQYDLIKLKYDKNNDSLAKSNNLINRKIEVQDIIKLINNNLIIYYLYSYLNNFNYCKSKNTFELNNRTLKITINNIIYNNSLVDSKNLYLLMCNLDESNEEINNTLQILFKTLIKFINNEVLTSENNILKEDSIITLNVLNFLCLIYGTKYLLGNKISYEKLKYLPILNHIYLQLIKNTKHIDFDRIEIHESLIKTDGEVDSFLNLETVSQKYKYLLKISSEEFVKSILKEIKNSPPEDNKTNNNFNNMVLKTPKILNIDYLLTLTNDGDSFINYKKIKTPEFIKLEKSFVITEEYLQLLYIINSNGFIDHSKLNIRITKFADSIINNILPLVDKHHDKLISTLLIMNNMIEYVFQNKPLIDNQSKLFILYRIIIPHLYNKFNINKFIDYFM